MRNSITTYTCPPIKELNYCTHLEIESMDLHKTKFLFTNGEKVFRLSLLHSCFEVGPNSIRFNFKLGNNQISFMALKKEKYSDTYDPKNNYRKIYDQYKPWH